MKKEEKLPDNIKPEMIGEKRYVRMAEGAKSYSVGLNTFRNMAAKAHAIIQKTNSQDDFELINYSQVEYVMDCLGKNTTKVHNIKSYLLTSLFNAGSTISGYYKAEVNYDMPQYAG